MYLCVHPEGQTDPCSLRSFEMDISKQLHAYEVEYHVLQDELKVNYYACEEASPWRSWRGPTAN